MGKIVWLASYPKSGNTWFRIFLSNLRGDLNKPADINDLDRAPIASARGIFDDEVGIEASDLTPGEIDRLRPELYENLAAESEETLFMKVHDAYTLVDGQTPLFPAAATRGVIYILRNPLDVAVSFADHMGQDTDSAITGMANEKNSFCNTTKKLHSQLRQKLLTWSGHVRSWTEQTRLPVCTLRYEDMQAHPVESFGRAVRFAGLEYSDTQIEKALALSGFEELKRQEAEKGFREKSPQAVAFFRKGQAGAWWEVLTDAQARRIEEDHGEMMKKFGYL